MTARKPAQCTFAAPPRPVARKALDRVLGTAGIKAALPRPEERREGDLVGAHPSDQRAFREVSAESRSAAASASPSAAGILRFATTTTSHWPSPWEPPRNHSRTSLLIRVRRTAFPTLRVTVIPSRVEPPSPRSRTKTRKYRAENRLPVLVARWNSNRLSRGRSPPGHSAMPCDR